MERNRLDFASLSIHSQKQGDLNASRQTKSTHTQHNRIVSGVSSTNSNASRDLRHADNLLLISKFMAARVVDKISQHFLEGDDHMDEKD